MKPLKIYCRPTHILDTHIVYFKLYGIQLSIHRIPMKAAMIMNPLYFSDMEDFVEVSCEDFAKFVSQYASLESQKRFKEEYQTLFCHPWE